MPKPEWCNWTAKNAPFPWMEGQIVCAKHKQANVDKKKCKGCHWLKEGT